jgi:hypothetical protein
LEAVEDQRFYKPELISWLKAQFPKDLPASGDDATVVAFLKTRLH